MAEALKYCLLFPLSERNEEVLQQFVEGEFRFNKLSAHLDAHKCPQLISISEVDENFLLITDQGDRFCSGQSGLGRSTFYQPSSN